MKVYVGFGVSKAFKRVLYGVFGSFTGKGRTLGSFLLNFTTLNANMINETLMICKENFLLNEHMEHNFNTKALL